MRGKAVFYPMGWDDNGLPTERRVQNYYGVRCDPSLPLRSVVRAAGRAAAKQPISSRARTSSSSAPALTDEDEKAFEHLWKHLGLSVDWSMTYATIGPRAQRCRSSRFCICSQRGQAYQLEAPTLWDVDFKTAVAQAELEDRERAGGVSPRSGSPSIRPWRRDACRRDPSGAARDAVEIETTRPELIPACVALVAHPDDARYQPLFGARGGDAALRCARAGEGASARRSRRRAAGIAMICTFGDITDVTWWRELGLPVRAVIQRGRHAARRALGCVRAGSRVDARPRARSYEELRGLSASEGARGIVEQLHDVRRPGRRAAAHHARRQVL